MSLDRRSFIGRAFAAVTAALATKTVLEAKPAPLALPAAANVDSTSAGALAHLPQAATPDAALAKLVDLCCVDTVKMYLPPTKDPASMSYDESKTWRGARWAERQWHTTLDGLTRQVAYWFIRKSDERLLTWTLHAGCHQPGEGPITDRVAVIENVTSLDRQMKSARDHAIDYLSERIGTRLLWELDRKGYEHMGVLPMTHGYGECAVVTNTLSGVSIRGMKQYDTARDVTMFRFDVVVG